MELREWARVVLLGATLEDKLLDPGGWSDEAPGPAVEAPRVPGRPPALRFDPDAPTEKAPVPGPGALEDPRARGRLLHFLANHELLAAELMALVLLRFPDAPAGFRRELALTLRDEQRHLQLYLERIRALGVEPGELPVNAYLWTSVADVASPLDFVTRMSLTFEQANLDFALHYAGLFRAVGDAPSAEVLERVHREEVAHVRRGFKWFERWRREERHGDGPAESDWEAYRRLLPPPLTPRRARGPGYQAEARRRAGLSPRFVEELRVFGHSLGRPPAVYLFNPGVEAELAGGGRDHAPPAPVAAVAADLAACPIYLARPCDLVVLRERPTTAWLAELEAAGVKLPQLEVVGPGSARAEARALADLLGDRPLASLRPWGWSPRARAVLGPLAPQISPGADPGAWVPDDAGLEAVARAAAKTWSAELRAAVWGEADVERREALGPAWLAGRACADVAEVQALARELAPRHEAFLVLKAPYGASGREARRAAAADLAAGRVEPSLAGWLERVLAAQGAVVVEPWLERVCDLSVQLEVVPTGAGAGVRLLGTTRFLADRRGQYEAHVLGRPFDALPPEVLAALHGQTSGPAPGFLRVLEGVARRVGEALAELGYRGPAGVDAFVHRREGRLLLQPLVEVNPRLTMGRVALALERRVRPGRAALWRHVGLARAGRDGPAFGRALARRLPPQVGPRGRLEAGALPTNDPTAARAVVSVLVVGRSLAACEAALEAALGTP